MKTPSEVVTWSGGDHSGIVASAASTAEHAHEARANLLVSGGHPATLGADRSTRG